jgi:hypothetical protein
MLGEQITEFKGKTISQRVLNAEGPTMETSLSFTGSIRGKPATEIETIVSRPASPGVLHGVGQGVIMVGESDMATYTGEGIIKITPSDIKSRGAIFFKTVLSGKLVFLNNVVGVFESEINADRNVIQKIWEWK